MKVAVLVPPNPPNVRIDQDDTYEQAEQVAGCLVELGHAAELVEYADHGTGTIRNLERAAPDLVFNLVEEVPEGADQVHLVTELLDRLGLRYTGARTASLMALADKHAMRAGLRAAGLPTSEGLDECPPDTTFIVKSVIEHGSLGMTAENVVVGAEAARQVIEKRRAELGGDWYAERYIHGREFDLALLQVPDGPRILPLAEMVFNRPDGMPRVMDYPSKWMDESTEAKSIDRLFPAREPQFDELERLAVAAWRSFDLTGFCHVDFRLDEAGNAFILDINANPSIGLRAGFCDAAKVAGMSQTDVVAALVAAA